MGEIAAKYGPKGLQVIRCVSGENELTALEFQKHYRLPVVHLLDVNRAVERQYNEGGWTFLMLVDAEGKVAYAETTSLARQEETLARLIQEMLGEDGKTTTVVRDGVPYVPATLARNGETERANRRDRFPSVACGPDGRIYVVFTSNRNGNSDVFIRTFDGKSWSADQAIAGTAADEYDGAVLVDRDNRVWVSWTSNADGKNYNVFATSFTDSSKPVEPTQLTHAEDDAMHARMTCDHSGRVWVTYYKWHKMNGYSRDKEVYARRCDGVGWSDEIHVSPDDVSQYEDHTDPTIVPYDDGVAVCWSWDFHPPRGYSGNARTPTIFLRTIDEDLKLGTMTTVSGRSIDTTPAVAVDRDHRIWCAWDSLVWDRLSGSSRKGLYFREADLRGQDQGMVGENLSGLLKNVCTPSFAGSPTGALTLVWSESDSQGKWELRSTFFDGKTGHRWTEPRAVVSEGDPRFPATAFDTDGQLWIAYSAETDKGREIRIIEQDLSVTSDAGAQQRVNHQAAVAQSKASQRLSQAREALRSKDKNIPLARSILLELADNHASDLDAAERCHLYVYLGYVEDLADNRETAIGWYEKAVPIEGARVKWIREVAEIGISRPVTWIRHLDQTRQTASGNGGKGRIIEPIGKGYVTYEAPAGPSAPKMDLSKAERVENFEILWKAIDRSYSFFEHKGINWQDVIAHYRTKVEAVETGEEYYRLLHQAVRELKDAHSWLHNYKDETRLARFSPAVSTRRIEGKAVVTQVIEGSEAFENGLRAGAVITRVEGLSVADQVERLRPMLRMCSSERNFQEIAYRQLLHGEEGSELALAFVPQGKETPVESELERGSIAGQPSRHVGFPVRKGRFVWSGIHPSGCGYIRILSFSGRMEIADEFDRVLETLKDTPALIIDIRDNPGGFGTAQPRIVGRFISATTKVATSLRKNGPRHDDFSSRDDVIAPAGDWQYTKPIALLTNAVTGSAADLFACRMIGTSRPITVGTTTHGNLTGIGVYVVLPCDLVVRVSYGYICDIDGRIIEGNGNVPDIRAELTLADVIDGTDSVIDCAIQALQKATPGEPVGQVGSPDTRERRLSLGLSSGQVRGHWSMVRNGQPARTVD